MEHLNRRVELDWLRVIAFAVLIFYHTAMLYVPNWEFHYKSAYTAVWLEYLMLLLSPWRMLLIWFISGVALRYIFDKQGACTAMLFRTPLLLLPLLFGVWVVVPVQLYAEMQQNAGMTLGYVDFYKQFIDLNSPLFRQYQSGIWPHVDVNHLWYLRELWSFTLLLAVLHIVFTSKLQAILLRGIVLPGAPYLLSALAVLSLLWAQLALEGDNQRELQGFVFLFAGYLLAKQQQFWVWLAHHSKVLLWICAANALIILLLYHFYWLRGSLSPIIVWGGGIVLVLQRVCAVLLILALAARYLTRSHPLLARLNKAVFPIYLWHQSVIIALVLWLNQYHLGGVLEGLLVLLGTGLFSWFLYRLTPRLGSVGLIMGYRSHTLTRNKWLWLFGCVLLLPLIMRIT
ncbi:acyltransferase family protein [Pseudoalteromonas 'SMAR']|uniref:acyltransferase family protein n=1 Tax=Pseudoalteromonas 'SMAR' TaxID=3416908 RepID=UPI003AF2A7B2